MEIYIVIWSLIIIMGMLISIKVARLRRNNGALGDITNVMSSENFSFYDKDPQEDFTKLVHLAGIVVSESACTTNTLPPSEHRVGTTPVTFDGTTLTLENYSLHLKSGCNKNQADI